MPDSEKERTILEKLKENRLVNFVDGGYILTRTGHVACKEYLRKEKEK